MNHLIFRSICRFSGQNQNLLKNFGIVNPNIYRNLRYQSTYLVFLNSMRVASTISLLILSPRRIKLLIQEPSVLTLELRLGICVAIQALTCFQVHCE